MTKVWLTGATGMLGTAICYQHRNFPEIDIYATSRKMVDVTNAKQIHTFMEDLKPAIIINAAGIIPETSGRPGRSMTDMIAVNAIAPLLLSEVAKEYQSRLIQISTDCVFSGDRQVGIFYNNQDKPDATSLYGMSKILGELISTGIILRTSFIGRQHGLQHWLQNQKDGARIQGWTNAIWSGSTVNAVATTILETVQNTHLLDIMEKDRRVFHLATADPISKYTLLQILANHYCPKKHLTIVPSATPVINRALAPSIVLPDIYEALNAK